MQNLTQVLTDFDIVHLRAIARQRSIVLESLTHRDVVEQLATALVEPLALEAAIRALSLAEREALAALQRAGGRQRAHLFLHAHGPIRRYGPGRLEREEPWLQPAGPAESLWYRGFLGRAFGRVGDETPEFVFIPDDLLPLLPTPEPAVDSSDKPAQAWPPLTPARIAPGHAEIVNHLYEMLLHVQLRHPRASEEALPTAGWLREAIGGADGGTPAGEYPAFIYHLSRQIDLLEIQSGRLHLTSETARRWLDRPAEWQWRSLIDTWRSDAGWNDLWHVPGIRPERAGWENDPIRSRERFLVQLRQAPAGQWHRIADLIDQIKTTDPDFQRPNGDYNSWYIRDARDEVLLIGFEHWDAIEGALIAYYLRHPLHWLGIVDLGCLEEGQETPDAFRLTPAGERALSTAEETEKGDADSTGTRPASLHLGDDLLIRLDSEATLYYRLQVERFAERRTEEGWFQITPRSLLTARSQKIQPAAIVNFLDRSAATPVPAGDQDEIRARWRVVDSIAMRRLVVLEFSEAAVLEWLQTDPESRHLLGDIVSPTRAQAPETHLPRLLKRLRQLGLDPDVTPVQKS
jgi:hypothetical protein